MTKTKFPLLKIKVFIIMEVTKKFGDFCVIQHSKMITRMMTDNATPGHIRFPGISYTFWNTYITVQLYHNYYLLFDNASSVI